MQKLEIDCPVCEDSILKSHGDEVKMRSKLIKWTKSGMYAVCKSCGTDVKIDSEILKSIESGFTFEIPKASR